MIVTVKCTLYLLLLLCISVPAQNLLPDLSTCPAITAKKAFWKCVYGEIDSSHTVIFDKATLQLFAVVKNDAVNVTVDSINKTAVISRRIVLKQGRKEFIREAVARAAGFPFITDSLAAHNLHPDLRWLPVLESGYLDTMVSDQNARGIWQFIPSTAQKYGMQPDEITDVYKSTHAFVAYFSKLYREFGDYGLALTAYNRGESGIREKMRKRKNASLEAILPDLDYQSGNYYAKFLSIVEIAHEMAGDTVHHQLQELPVR